PALQRGSAGILPARSATSFPSPLLLPARRQRSSEGAPASCRLVPQPRSPSPLLVPARRRRSHSRLVNTAPACHRGRDEHMELPFPIQGLCAATHTPFSAQGALHLDAVNAQAAHLLRQNIRFVFIGGTTGESHSLTVDERRALASRWTDVARGTDLKVIVHVGSNCVADSCALARHAEEVGATAIAALAPSYFKPRDVDALTACCAEISGAAPQTPFYYYDIPSM